MYRLSIGGLMAKNIIICFDGTRNDPDDAEQEIFDEGGVADDGISNILKLYFLFGGKIENLNQISSEPDDPLLDSVFANQPVFYFQGVGTYGGPIGQLLNAALAPRLLDVGNIIRNGIEVLKAHYQPGDKVIVFGFSRGAAIARRFSKVISDAEHSLNLGEKPVRFLGVFDTVASFGLPNLQDSELPPTQVVFKDKNRVSDNVEQAVHLVALDERRNAFKPTLMAAEARITEIWLPGVHSDVGGGYFYDGLSDVSLTHMLDEVAHRMPDIQIRSVDDVVQDEFDSQDFGLDKADIDIVPNHLATIHWHTRIGDIFLSDRDPRVCASKNNAAVNQVPLIHAAAIDRIVDEHTYETAALFEGIQHRIYERDLSISGQRPLDANDYRQSRPRDEISLSIGQSKTVQVQAAQLNCPTNIKVCAGEGYRFSFNEEVSWVDKTISCGATGWQAKEVLSLFKRPFFAMKEGERRHADANWFELLGNVNRDDGSIFRVCKFCEETVVFDQDGELFMFPNDLEDYYDNNRGFLEVTVTRVS